MFSKRSENEFFFCIWIRVYDVIRVLEYGKLTVYPCEIVRCAFSTDLTIVTNTQEMFVELLL